MVTEDSTDTVVSTETVVSTTEEMTEELWFSCSCPSWATAKPARAERRRAEVLNCILAVLRDMSDCFSSWRLFMVMIHSR